MHYIKSYRYNKTLTTFKLKKLLKYLFWYCSYILRAYFKLNRAEQYEEEGIKLLALNLFTFKQLFLFNNFYNVINKSDICVIIIPQIEVLI